MTMQFSQMRATAVVMASCALVVAIPQAAAQQRMFIDVGVMFVYQGSGQPIGVDDVAIIESVDNISVFTQELKTDATGEIHLRGYYCLPMSVAVVGGYAEIHAEYLESSYRVVVERGAETRYQTLGEPLDSIVRNLDKIRDDCRF